MATSHRFDEDAEDAEDVIDFVHEECLAHRIVRKGRRLSVECRVTGIVTINGACYTWNVVRLFPLARWKEKD